METIQKLNTFNRYGRKLEKQIRPMSHPIAIKFLKSEKDIPKGAKRPKNDYKSCMPTCSVFALSRKNGFTMAQLKEDMWCPEPVIGFGLSEPPKYFMDGYNRYCDGVETLEVGATWANQFPRLEAGKYVGFVSAPLITAKFEPDVVVIYCNSAQLLRMLLAMAVKDGNDITTRLSGHAACTYAVVPSMISGECKVAVPCRGDRGHAGCQDDELIFSVPKGKLKDLVEGLEHAGTGFVPTRIVMQYQYKLNPAYAKLCRLMGMKKADGTEIK